MGSTFGLELAVRSLVAPLFLAARWMGSSRVSDGDLPAARLSPSLLAKIVLDEIFFTAELLSAQFIAPRERRRIRLEANGALRFLESRGWVDEPLGYHSRPPVLEAPSLSSRETNGFRFAHMQFDSGYEPHPGEPGRARWLSYRANRTAHAWVLQHPGPPRPWLICIHGYRMGSPLVDLVGFRARWLHEKRGLNIALPVLPLHGPRTAGRRSGDGFLTGDFLDTLHVQAQAMWDLRRIVSWIRRQKAPAVGLYGLSLGGYTAALLASLERDLQCVIAGIPATDFVRLAFAQIPSAVRWLSDLAGLDWSAMERMMRVVSPMAFRPLVPHERRYLFAGVADRLVPPDHVLELWRHWGCPRLLWYQGSHISFRWEKQVKELVSEALQDSGLTGEGYGYPSRAASA